MEEYPQIIRLPDLGIGLELLSAEGETLLRREERGHSWTRNAYNLVARILLGASLGSTFANGNITLKDSFGSVHSVNYFAVAGSSAYGLGPGLAVDTFGIQIGSGDTPFSFNDYILAAKISTGSSAGRLDYEAMAVPGYAGMTYDDPTKTYSIPWVRHFNNNSGDTVTVKELGLVISTYTTYKYLLARDVLDSPLAVPDHARLKATYTISITIEA